MRNEFIMSGSISYPRSRTKQRGDFLIESLIGMALMAIIGMGVVFVTSKMSKAQRDMRLQEIAVNQMRAVLLNNGTGGINICAVTPQVKLPGVPDADIKVDVIGCNEKITAEVAGVTVADIPKPLFISVSLLNNNTALGGEIIVGGSGS